METKEIWVSALIPPADDRAVLVKTKELLDPEVASYYNGKWVFSNSDFSDDVTVEAWREVPKANGSLSMSFRTAEEARYLSRAALALENKGTYDCHFFEVRALIIKATTIPNVWGVNIGSRPIEIINKLLKSGFVVEEEEDGTYYVRWDIVPEEKS